MPKIYTRKEAKERRLKFAALAGIADGLSTLISIVIIFACVILLTALVTWIISDAQSSFSTIYDVFRKAIILPENTPSPLQ